MSVEFYRGSPGKFDSRTLNRNTLNSWTGRTQVNFGGKSHPECATFSPDGRRSPRETCILHYVYLSIYLSIYLALSLSIYIYIYMYVYIYIYICMYLFTCIYIIYPPEGRTSARKRVHIFWGKGSQTGTHDGEIKSGKLRWKFWRESTRKVTLWKVPLKR